MVNFKSKVLPHHAEETGIKTQLAFYFYVREDIPFKLVSFKNDDTNVKHFFIENNLRKKKRLLSSSYNPHSNLIETRLDYLKKGLHHFSGKFDNCIWIGVSNSEISNKYLKVFGESYNLKSLTKNPTCFKNHDKPTCNDLILANRPQSFQSSCTKTKGLSDFHRLTVTA